MKTIYRPFFLFFVVVLMTVSPCTSAVDADFDGLHHPIVEQFESGSIQAPWSTLGDSNWTVTNYPLSPSGFAAQAPFALNDNQSASLQRTVNITGYGTVHYFYGISSEVNYDFLHFYIDDILQSRASVSGEIIQRGFEFRLSKGSHILRWTYTKDESFSSGTDTAWIANIEIYGEDNCPNTANADQLDTNNDRLGDACDTDDSDNDGVLGTNDNCPDIVNTDQLDTDNDGLGNACDIDDDNDGLFDDYENQYSFLDPLNSADAVLDFDGDGSTNLEEFRVASDPGNAKSVPVSEFSENCGKTWQWLAPLPQGKRLNAIDWSAEQGQFVAVGKNGTILTNHNGEDWQIQTSGTTSHFNGVSWTGAYWLAVGADGIISKSLDGVNWVSQSSGVSEYLYSIKGNGSSLVAVGNKGVILTSSDGEAWQRQSSGVSNTLTDISWTGTRWVIVGYEVILTSRNGTTWRQVRIPNIPILDAVDWNGTKLVAVGVDDTYAEPSGAIITSTDGLEWLTQDLGTDIDSSSLTDITWDGTQWIALNKLYKEFQDSQILTSSNGEDWLPKSSETPHSLLSISSNDEYLSVAVGKNGFILSGHNGGNWIPQSTVTTENYLKSIAWNGTQWITVGEHGTILTSSSGVNWKIQTSVASRDSIFTQDHLNSVHWNGTQWVVVGREGGIFQDITGMILTSSDGVDWQAQILETGGNALNSVHWNGTQWLVVGDGGTILTSSDAVDWQTQISRTTNPLHSVHWNGTKWLVVGDGGTILTSFDGINWQAQTSGTTNLYSVHWNGTQWGIAGAEATILISDDGVNWQLQTQVTDDDLQVTDADLYGISSNGTQWIAVGEDGTLLKGSTDKDWLVQTSETDSSLSDVYWTGTQFVVVGERGAIITSPCHQKTIPANSKAIIIAGGGNSKDPLQDATNANANLAYQTLRQRGISENNIRYFNAIAQTESNIPTEVPTKESIKNSIQNINSWETSTTTDANNPVIIYMVDHGGTDIFYLNKPANDYAEIIKASEVSTWLDEMQENTGARASFIYDACHSGSFANDLNQSNTNYDRINLFSSGKGQSAFFGGQGQLSFSQFFWSNVAVGQNLRSAFRSSEVAIRSATQNGSKTYQDAELDDNGDGGNSYTDGSLALDTTIGNVSSTTNTYPIVINSQGSKTVYLNQGTGKEIYAKVDLSPDKIKRVWAIVIPPDNKTTGSEPQTDLPEIELVYDITTDEYRATSNLFTQNGRYTLSYYAKTKATETEASVTSRFPLVALITATNTEYTEVNPVKTRVLIVAGGHVENDPLYKAATKNANLAYKTLRNRGINSKQIIYLNFKEQDIAKDSFEYAPTKPTYLAIETAINHWKDELGKDINADAPLLVYFTGTGTTDTFHLSSSVTVLDEDKVSATDVAGWLNSIQSVTSAHVTFIYDAAHAGSFLDELANPNYERTTLLSTQAEDGAYFGSGGQLSFSHFFWVNTARGMDVQQAYRESLVAMQTTTRGLTKDYGVIRQRALLDDNGDGASTKDDGRLAETVQLGINAATAAVFPVVFYHQETRVKNSDGSLQINLVAKVDLPRDLIENVWAVAIPSGQTVDSKESITDNHLLVIPLDSYNNTDPQNPQWEGSSVELASPAYEQYTITYYAKSANGDVSVEADLSSSTATTDTYEDDDTSKEATLISVVDRTAQYHDFKSANDEDWVKFYASKDHPVPYTLHVNHQQRLTDVKLRLYTGNSDGTNLTLEAVIDEGGVGVGRYEIYEFNPEVSGHYYIQVTSANQAYGDETGYELRVYHAALSFWGAIAGNIINSVTLEAVSNPTITSTSLEIPSWTGDENGGFIQAHPPAPKATNQRYTLTISAANYKSKTMENVSVEESFTEPTILENFKLEPINHDTDSDGIFDSVDNCPLNANANQADKDGDNIGDACDSDIDGDGKNNSVDNCPLKSNVNQADKDRDSIGDACDPDIDGDGKNNNVDNCPLIANQDICNSLDKVMKHIMPMILYLLEE